MADSTDQTDTGVTESTDLADSLELDAPVDDTDTSTESTPAEDNKEVETTEESDSTEEQSEEAESDDNTEADNPENQEQTDDQGVDLKAMSKEERKEYFQQLQAERQQHINQVVDQNYQPTPLDDLTYAYMEEGYDQFQATMLARETVREQEKQIAEAKAEIAQVNMAIQTDAVEVMSTLPWTDSSKPDDFDKETTKIAGEVYDSLLTTKDPRTGQIIEAKIPLKQWYTIVDQIRNSGSSKAALKAQKDAEAQMAAVAPSTSSSPSSNKSPEDKQADDLAAAFDAV